MQESQRSGPAATRRVIRARLTIRGFKDVDARMMDNYAGASQRYSQRVLVSVAAQHQWDICTTDISNAFLQGVTYTELAEATGEPLREVNFVLPAYCVAVLRTIPAMNILIRPLKCFTVKSLGPDATTHVDASHSN